MEQGRNADRKQNKSRRATVTAYEQQAVLFLTKRGYEIIETNFYAGSGEIDIIARESGYLVFIEVKYRRNRRLGGPEGAVGWQKQRRIIKAAKYYLYRHNYPEDTPCRFDVVTYCGGDQAMLIPDAFELTEG